MTATVMPIPIVQFSDQNGAPLAGGKMYTYAAGTSTPLAVYSDILLTVPYSNPIILDAAGTPGAPVYFSAASYKIVVTDSDDVQVVFADNIPCVASNP